MNSFNLEGQKELQTLSPQEAEAVLRRYLEGAAELNAVRLEQVAATLRISESEAQELLAAVRADEVTERQTRRCRSRKLRDVGLALLAGLTVVIAVLTITGWLRGIWRDDGRVALSTPASQVVLAFNGTDTEPITAKVNLVDLSSSQDLRALALVEIEETALIYERSRRYKPEYDSSQYVLASESSDYNSPAFTTFDMRVTAGPHGDYFASVRLPVYHGKRREIVEWVRNERSKRLEEAFKLIEARARLIAQR